MEFRNAKQASYGSTLIETFFKSNDGTMLSISRGTGFFTKTNTIVFLVTNWHVLTNRDPNDPKNTLSQAQSPTHIQLHVARIENPKHFVPMEYFPLYDEDGNPNWLEGSEGFGWADIALLPGRFPDDAVCPLVEDFAPFKGTVLEPGIDVCLIGFPFGRNKTNPFPIWKKAMVASEPAYTIDGKPFAYLDTPGRPGMSGSPVYAISDAIFVSDRMHEAMAAENAGQVSALYMIKNLDAGEISNPKNRTRGLEFVGIYSGSLGDQSLDRLNLGRFWASPVLEAIKKNPARGSNPFPPDFW
jgi:hypothetical protein